MKRIDTHLHFYDGGFPPGAFDPVKVDNMLAMMDHDDICSGWISSLSSLVTDPVEGNKSLYNFCKGNTDRLKPFYSFNPNLPLPLMKAEVRRCVEDYGARGFKIHPWLMGCSISTGAMYELSSMVAEYHVPLLFHDGTPPYSDPLQIASLGAAFPQLKIILGHSGLCDMHHSAIRAYQKNRNIYLCFCCTTLGDIEDICQHCEPDRLLFGTDFYGIASFSSYIDNMIDSIEMADINDALKEKIFFANAQQLMDEIERQVSEKNLSV